MDASDDEFNHELGCFQPELSITTHEFSSDRRHISIGILAGRRVARKYGYSKEEAEVMRFFSRVPHPNLIQLVDIDDGDQCLVMEGVKDGLKLYDYYNRLHRQAFTFQQAVSLLRQLASGLEYLHLLGIIHHDLNYDNVLVSLPSDATAETVTGLNVCLKICDFGLSEMVDVEGHGSEDNRGSGTGHWRAPEQLLTDRSVPITTKIDIFPLGLIASHLVYHGRSLAQNHFCIPLDLVDLMERCKGEHPVHRPTASQLIVELEKTSLVNGKTMAGKIIGLVQRALENLQAIPPELNELYTKALAARAESLSGSDKAE